MKITRTQKGSGALASNNLLFFLYHFIILLSGLRGSIWYFDTRLVFEVLAFLLTSQVSLCYSWVVLLRYGHGVVGGVEPLFWL